MALSYGPKKRGLIVTGKLDKTCKSNGALQVAIFEVFSGERVRNTWITFREAGDSPGKLGLIPHVVERLKVGTARPATS